MSDEITEQEMSQIDKEIKENEAKLKANEKDIEARAREKVLRELKEKEDKETLKKQNAEMQAQIEALKKSQEEQKNKFEETIAKFSGNATSKPGTPELTVKDKIKSMTTESLKEMEESQREATFEVFMQRGQK
jgi:hypothetical protein